MESKRGYKLRSVKGRITLLIEPVWNRNVFLCRVGIVSNRLLIEPVWNRNQCPMDDSLAASNDNLLIEPVWNRNMHKTSAQFTRTNF